MYELYFYIAVNSGKPSSYTLTNNDRDVKNWGGETILMPSVDFTLCFWVKVNQWESQIKSTVISMARPSKRKYYRCMYQIFI